MELPSDEAMIKPISTISETLTKPVPRPFSIEALMSDSGPKRNSGIAWNLTLPQQYQINRDTDSDGSLDMELAQDLSRRSLKDGKYIFNHFNITYLLVILF
jgi:hypothetical protein